MADEARVTSSLYIRKGTDPVQLEYQSRPSAFTADVAGTKGPVPGAIEVTLAGVDVDLSELTTPGLCRIANQDDANTFEYGVWDPEGNTFFPLGEVGPGESYVIKLSRLLQWELGTGIGTSGPETNRLRLKSFTDVSINALVEAFEV